jgi:hypothetical protein
MVQLSSVQACERDSESRDWKQVGPGRPHGHYNTSSHGDIGDSDVQDALPSTVNIDCTARPVIEKQDVRWRGNDSTVSLFPYRIKILRTQTL